MSGHNRALWVVQWIWGLYFIAIGVLHFVVPDGLPDLMSWMYELSDSVHYVVGAAEILGGLGLILPGLTGIRPELTTYAAIGLTTIMIAAAIWHLSRGETRSIATDAVNTLAMVYVVYGRTRLAPLSGQAPSTEN